MVEISKVNLIECPDCKRKVFDNVNYCRFCGHDFNETPDESSGRFSKFLKNALKGIVVDDLRYCTNCKSEIRDFSLNFCDNCGTMVPYQGVKYFCSCGSVRDNPYCDVCNKSRSSRNELNSDEFYQIWHNQVIIPLSNEYAKDLSNNNFKKYFNLNIEQENHIIYKMVHNIIFKEAENNIVELFKSILEETRQNYEDIEKAILNTLEQALIQQFNNEGLSSSRTSTIKREFTETVETPHIKNKHGTGTKVLAAAVAGPLGFVATSGVKQETDTKQVHHKGKYVHEKVTLNNKRITYETYTDDNSSGFKYSMNHSVTKIVVEWHDVKSIDEENYLILKSGDTINCPSFSLMRFVKQSILDVVGSIDVMSNKSYYDKYIDVNLKEGKNIIRNIIENHIASNNVTEPNNSSVDVDALERIMNMYEKGLLTDDEFVAMKQNIIGNNSNNIPNGNDGLNDNNEISPKFCGNCGAKIVDNSKFCIQCGTKLN